MEWCDEDRFLLAAVAAITFAMGAHAHSEPSIQQIIREDTRRDMDADLALLITDPRNRLYATLV